MTFNEWARAHPAAAVELAYVTAQQQADEPTAERGSESHAQQQARFAISRVGGLSWRNNVGATPTKQKSECPRCRFKYETQQRPIRYGLANDSAQLNAVVKSSDLIGILPRMVTPEMVGGIIGQFIAVECKKPGWRYTGNGREEAQQSFLTTVINKGGKAFFSTGGVEL